MFGPPHKMNPLRARLDRATRAARLWGSASSTSDAAAASHRGNGGARAANRSASDLGDQRARASRACTSSSRERRRNTGSLSPPRRSRSECRARSTSSPCMEMLEHVPDPGVDIVAACAALARPGGVARRFDDQPQPRRRTRSPSSPPRVRPRAPAEGTHDYAKFRHARGSRAVRTRRRASESRVRSPALTHNPLTQIVSPLADDTDVNYMMAFRRGE